MITDLFFLIVVSIFVGGASGYLGSFMVLKRMSLVGDALSHVALPGIAVALIYNINPMVGAFLALAVATFGIWYLSENSKIYPEALVGIFFTVSLSLGLLLTPEPELLEALFGDIDKITFVEGAIAILGSGIVFFTTWIISKKLILGIVSTDLAKSQKINVSTINLIYLLLVGLIVALGVRFLGTLLTGAMVIIPAVSAKNVSNSIKSFGLNSILFGAFSCGLGVVLASYLGIASGPVIVLVAAFVFVMTYLFKN